MHLKALEKNWTKAFYNFKYDLKKKKKGKYYLKLYSRCKTTN